MSSFTTIILKFSFHPFAILIFGVAFSFYQVSPHSVSLRLYFAHPFIDCYSFCPYWNPSAISCFLSGREKVGTLAVMADFCSFRVLRVDKQNLRCIWIVCIIYSVSLFVSPEITYCCCWMNVYRFYTYGERSRVTRFDSRLGKLLRATIPRL